MSRFFSNFFVSQYRKILQGNPSVLCFGKFPVANKFMDGQGVVSKISFKKFLSHSVETFLRGTLLCCVSEFFWWRKSFWIRGGGSIKIFLRNFFCLTVPRKIVGEPFRVSLFSGNETFYTSEGYVMIFCRIVFVSQCRKICRWTL